MYNCYIAECSKAAAVSPCPNTAPNPWPHPSMHRFTCTEEDRKKNMFFTHTRTEFSHSRKTSCVVFFAKGLCTCVCVCVLFTFLCYQWIRHLRSTLGLVGNSYLIVRKIPGTYLLMRCCLACCFYLLAVWCVISSVNSHFLLIVSMYTVLMCDLSVSRKRYRLSNILL